MLMTNSAGEGFAQPLRLASPEVFKDMRATKPFLPIPIPLWSFLASKVRGGEMSLSDFGAFLMLYQACERNDYALAGGYRRLCGIWGCSQKTAQRILGRLEQASLVIREYASPGHHRTPLAIVRLTLPYAAGQIMLKHAPDRSPAKSVDEKSSRDNRVPPGRDKSVHLRTDPETESENTGTRAPDRGLSIQPSAKQERTQSLRDILKTGVEDVAAELRRLEQLASQRPPETQITHTSHPRWRTRDRKDGRNLQLSPIESWTASLLDKPVVPPARTDFALRLPVSLRNRLEKGLASRSPSARARLMEEIAYSVTSCGWRCGPDKAVSVCLKLVREGRWSRPSGMPVTT